MKLSQKEYPQNAEILCIGSELLLGNILNSNAQWLAEELLALGINHYRQCVVGDNINRIEEAVIEASNRCSFLLTTGGLGPTPDDLTTEAIARAFKTPLEGNELLWKEIQKRIKSQGKKTAENNKKQTFFPKGAEIIPNPKGTAPGIIWSPKPGFTVITLPGVPSEMKTMWNATVSKWLQGQRLSEVRFASKVLRFAGIAESNLAEELSDLLNKSNPTIAPYAGMGDLKLRITASGATLDEASELIKPYETQIRERMGDFCYGSDNDCLASVVINLLRERKETISFAESCTGGGLGNSLASIPGASKVFWGGVTAYQNSIKQSLLKVSSNILEIHGAVSEEVVKEMAINVRSSFCTDWAISVSGVAGPNGGTKSKPVGLVHFGIVGPNHCEATQQFFGEHLGREEIQRLSISYCLNQLRLILINRS